MLQQIFLSQRVSHQCNHTYIEQVSLRRRNRLVAKAHRSRLPHVCPTSSPTLPHRTGHFITKMGLPDDELEQTLTELRNANPVAFDRLVSVIKFKAREPRPLFPADVDIPAIPPVPESELDSFKAKHIDSSAIKDYKSPEAKDRLEPLPRVRVSQYARWQWACDNFDTYVNMLRVSGHSDEGIAAMVKGRPLCFKDAATMSALVGGLKKLKPALEAEKGWGDVSFVFTGSSVPGFSQNPLKGRKLEPTRITNNESSDVDICVCADGVERFVHRLRKEGLWTASYPTTCTPTRNGTRYGVDWSVVEEGALGEFYNEWKKRLEGGLQLTFSENSLEIPPWEMPIKLD
eukprot:GFKZ01001081.1.p1 GENE.GFKZ01001081.1~~GFKZ01001081.1.p1  ORF type:complete len:345 (+),score=33.26 GFKZ01001081.1:184-1218(+)